jgi:pSer/pThr/pTyr-binding forkhead associated (FHA) protein
MGTTVMRFELSGRQQRQTLTETSIKFPLLMIDSPLCHFVAPLRESTILLGRAPECGLIIPSPIVARRQATLQRVEGGGYVVTSLGGSNPLLWQGKPVQQRSLQDGDTLTIDARIPGVAVVMRYSTLAL